MQNTALSRSV